MRKAGKKRIKKALSDMQEWLSKINPRIDAITVPGAADELRKWIDDIRSRITEGDLTFCTQSLIASVVRNVKYCESGFYSHVENETWHIANRGNQ